MDAEETINSTVYRVPDYPGRHLIVVHSGIYLSLEEIACLVLSNPRIFPDIGVARPSIDRSFFNNFALGRAWEEFGGLKEYKATRGFAVGLDRRRYNLVSLLVTSMLLYLVLHEYSHGLAGHISVVGQKLSEIENNQLDESKAYQRAAELHADRNALEVLIRSNFRKRIARQYQNFTTETIEEVAILSIFLVTSLWPWLGVRYRNGLNCSEAIVFDSDHPPGKVRSGEAFYALEDIRNFANGGKKSELIMHIKDASIAREMISPDRFDKARMYGIFASQSFPEHFQFSSFDRSSMSAVNQYKSDNIAPIMHAFTADGEQAKYQRRND
ncbi:MAG: hypothetical protein AAFQ58_22685 [Pseudomonadota bacterium]